MFLLRADWGARKPKTSLSSIGQVNTIFVHHSVTVASSDPKADARQIQDFHMDSRNYTDIAYTLLVHPDGTVLEGRTVGGQAAQGAHTSGWNSKSVAVCVIGNFETDEVTPKIMSGLNEAVAYMKLKQWVTLMPQIRPHSDVNKTACCGKNLKAKLGEITGTIGDVMSADRLTKEEVIELHYAYFGSKPGSNYDYRHVGGPLQALIHDWRGNPQALKNGGDVSVDCQSKIDAIYTKVKTAFGK